MALVIKSMPRLFTWFETRLGWIVSYADGELHDLEVAPVLVSLLQGSLMLGSFGASRYQHLGGKDACGTISGPSNMQLMMDAAVCNEAILRPVGLGALAA